jgi:hypothetical protein
MDRRVFEPPQGHSGEWMISQRLFNSFCIVQLRLRSYFTHVSTVRTSAVRTSHIHDSRTEIDWLRSSHPAVTGCQNGICTPKGCIQVPTWALKSLANHSTPIYIAMKQSGVRTARGPWLVVGAFFFLLIPSVEYFFCGATAFVFIERLVQRCTSEPGYM